MPLLVTCASVPGAPVMVVPMVMVSGQTGVQGQPGIPQQELPQFWQELPQS